MTYQKASADLPPAYWDCPGWCPERKQRLQDTCPQCPVGAQEREMEEELEAALDERVGDAWREWGRDNLLEHVYKVSYLADAPDDSWTATTARLVQIFKGQQSRLERIDEYNRRQAALQRKNG